MLQLIALLVGATGGFVASRLLRRPDHAPPASSVARHVGSSISRHRRLELPELQRACYLEMTRHVIVDRRGHRSVPARFRIHLNPGDLARIDEARRWFTEGLIDALLHGSAEHGWSISGPVQITYLSDSGRPPGAPRALPSETAGPTTNGVSPPAPAPVTQGLSVVRTDTGERFPMDLAPITIGRAPERTITIRDDRVSRAHATIVPRSGGWWIIDDGSSNGTRLGSETLMKGRAQPLRSGDMISVGPVHLRVIPSSVSGPPGTAPARLGEHTRTSGEVIPRFREISGDRSQRGRA